MALSLYLITFNCARTLVQPSTIAPYLFSALAPEAQLPDLVVFSLQELAPISYAFLGGSFLTPYFNAFRTVVKLAAKEHSYVNVLSRNLGMTGLMVFARDDIADNINWLRTAGVGVGVGEMGNKGAIGARLGYRISSSEEMQLTFVAAHLAPMEDALQQRNEDYKSIVQRLVFVPDSASKAVSEDETVEDAPLLQGETTSRSGSESGLYSNQSHLFFAGDLNYRTSLLRPSMEDYNERFPQPTTDENDPRHFRHLLVDDQLTQQVKEGNTLHGLKEAMITFPPTYKYDNNRYTQAVTLDDQSNWHWARHRWPSWCDRIFFRQRADVQVQPLKYTCLPLFSISDHRPVVLLASVPLKVVSINGGEAPFSIDPEWKSRRSAARRKELAVGIMAYLALTWEGNGLLVATAVGFAGAVLILRSLLTG